MVCFIVRCGMFYCTLRGAGTLHFAVHIYFVKTIFMQEGIFFLENFVLDVRNVIMQAEL